MTVVSYSGEPEALLTTAKFAPEEDLTYSYSGEKDTLYFHPEEDILYSVSHDDIASKCDE